MEVLTFDLLAIAYAHVVGGWDNSELCLPATYEELDVVITDVTKNVGVSRKNVTHHMVTQKERCLGVCDPQSCKSAMESILASPEFKHGGSIHIITEDGVFGKKLMITNKPLVKISHTWITAGEQIVFTKGPYNGWKLVRDGYKIDLVKMFF